MHSETDTITREIKKEPLSIFHLYSSTIHKYLPLIILVALTTLTLYGCGGHRKALRMETTAYCGCGQCCGWERGSWKFLKLDFWNRTITTGENRGQEYSGLTASGTVPREPNPKLLHQPWCLFFPWLWASRDGTLAADTNYHPFGTRFYIPGYGYGVVEDRGSAIKGEKRLDLFFDSHNRALEWGRKKINVYKVD